MRSSANVSTAVQFRGFTLVEMLAVVALTAILSGSVFGLARGAHERTAVARARAELAVLSLAIEAWRGQYGDYPAAADPAEFFESLTGRRGRYPSMTTATTRRTPGCWW